MKNQAIYILTFVLFLSVNAISQQTDSGYEKKHLPAKDPHQEQVDYDPMVVPEAMKNTQIQLQAEEYLPAGQSDQTEQDISPMLVRDTEMSDRSSGYSTDQSNPGSDKSGPVENDPQVVNPTLPNPKKSEL